MVGSIGLGRGQLVNSVSVEVSVEVDRSRSRSREGRLHKEEKNKNEKFTPGANRTHAHKIYVPPSLLTYHSTNLAEICTYCCFNSVVFIWRKTTSYLWKKVFPKKGGIKSKLYSITTSLSVYILRWSTSDLGLYFFTSGLRPSVKKYNPRSSVDILGYTPLRRWFSST